MIATNIQTAKEKMLNLRKRPIEVDVAIIVSMAIKWLTAESGDARCRINPRERQPSSLEGIVTITIVISWRKARMNP